VPETRRVNYDGEGVERIVDQQGRGPDAFHPRAKHGHGRARFPQTL
jgi:hypothetical protein